MLKRYASGFVLLLVAAAAQAQVSRVPFTPRCDCSETVIINPDGGLNMNHCNAAQVLAVLDGYTGRTAKLLPERVEPADLDLLARKLEQQRKEAVRSLLRLMSVGDLERFLPFVLNNNPPGRITETTPGTWTGRQFSCLSAVYWINEGLERVEQVSTILANLLLETQMYPANPSHFCDPALLANSIYYTTAVGRFGETWDWLQLSADNMTAGTPALASISSYAAWYASIYGSFGFVVAHSQPPFSGDDRCTEVADAGLALAEVGAAARQAYEQADLCARGL